MAIFKVRLYVERQAGSSSITVTMLFVWTLFGASIHQPWLLHNTSQGLDVTNVFKFSLPSCNTTTMVRIARYPNMLCAAS